jgi:hypothetical protein
MSIVGYQQYLFPCLSIRLHFHLFAICLFAYLPVYICLPDYLPTFLSVCFGYPSVCVLLTIYPTIALPVYIPAGWAVCLFIHLPACLFISLLVYPSAAWLPARLLISLHVCLSALLVCLFSYLPA